MKPDFKQVSTWRGLLVMLASTGIVIKPEYIEAIAACLGFGFSMIEIFRDERSPKGSQQ